MRYLMSSCMGVFFLTHVICYAYHMLFLTHGIRRFYQRSLLPAKSATNTSCVFSSRSTSTTNLPAAKQRYQAYQTRHNRSRRRCRPSGMQTRKSRCVKRPEVPMSFVCVGRCS